MPTDTGTPRITFRCPAALKTAIQAAADSRGLDLADWIRLALSRAVKIPHETLLQGFAALDESERAAILKRSHASRRRNSKKSLAS